MKKRLFLIGIIVFLFSLSIAYATTCGTQTISVQSNACNGEYVDVIVSGRYYMDTDEATWCGANFGVVEIDFYLYEEDWSSSDDLIDQYNGDYQAVEAPMFCSYVDYSHKFNVRLSDFAGGIEGDTIEIYGYIIPHNGPYDGECSTSTKDIDITFGQCGSGVCCDLSSCNFRPSSYKCADNVQTDYGCPWGTSPGDDVGIQHADRYCSGSSSSCSGSLQWDSWTVYDNCNSDEMCIDNNPSCQGVACDSDSDCGTSGWINAPYCSGDDVYQTYRTWTCYNPGTPSSSCSYSDQEQLKESCITCSGGTCAVECNSDSDCGTGGWWVNNEYCSGGDVWDIWREDKCYNPGTASSYCGYTNSDQERESCPNGCSSGSCVIECDSDSDCGTDGFVGSNYCNGDDVWDYYRIYTCSNPGTTSASCSYSDNAQLKQNCPTTCLSGVCSTIACYDNDDCGTDDWLGNEYCIGLDVIDTYRTYTCSNPGTASASCGHTDVDQTKETCTYSCSAGACQIPACFDDDDCGTDRWMGNSYCNGTEVWDDYRIYTCSNPGTLSASCSYSDNDQLKKTCTNACISGSCDDENHLWLSDNVDDTIYKLTKDGVVINSFPSPGATPTDLAFDGTYLWCADLLDRTVYKLTTDGTVVDSFLTKDLILPNGLAFDGIYLWYTSDTMSYKITTDGTFVDSYNTIGTLSTGLAWNGTELYNADRNDDMIYWYNLASPTGFASPGTQPRGLAWDGEYFWNVDGDNNKIYKLTTSGAVATSFDAPGSSAWGLAYELFIECDSDSDCGTDGWLGNYCKNEDVWNIYRNYHCNNPGTISASCSYIDTDQIIINCPVTCSNGVCTDIACFDDNDCGTDGLLGNEYCNGDDVWEDYRTWNCNNPGTASASCSHTDAGQLKQDCIDTCLEGNCVTVECYSDLDCGEDIWLDNSYCNGLQVWNTFREHICNNPGTASASCSFTETEQLKQTCREDCAGGSCLEEDYLWSADSISTTDTIYRLDDNGNLIDSFDAPGTQPRGLAWDGAYLWHADNNNDKIHKIDVNGIVVDSFDAPGTSPSGLAWDGTYLWHTDTDVDMIYKLTTSGTVVDSFDSPGTYPTGLAWDGTYLWSADGSINGDIYKLTTSGAVATSFDAPGTYSWGLAWDGTYLWNTDNVNEIIYKITTDGTVIDSFSSQGQHPTGLAWQEYSDVICSLDSDCGTDGFIEVEYCNGDDVRDIYRTWTCNNPGTSSSSCTYFDNDQLKQDCGTSGWIGSPYCSGDDLWQTYRTNVCESNSSGAYCVSNDENQLKEDCIDNCESGACVSIECYTDSECGTDEWLETSYYCNGNDVISSYRNYTCSNPGTAGSFCNFTDAEQTKENCAYKCENGVCINCIKVCNFGNCYEYCI
ncbi:hypothetical protein KY343_00490 [Candidatus Woesearchaeota archaeon]|nr:hypothetical protein [Candidatus Woesearchaeota archaeon]